LEIGLSNLQERLCLIHIFKYGSGIFPFVKDENTKLKKQMKQLFYILILAGLTLECKPKSTVTDSFSAVVFYRTQGNVQFYDTKGKLFTPKLLDLLHDGDKIQTNSKSQAEFLLSTGGVIRLLANSELILNTKILSEQNVTKSTLKLTIGRVFVKQPNPLKKGETLQVVTPTQIAGVRGTEFLTEVTAESSQVLVSEGTVQADWTKDDTSTAELSENAEYISEGNKSEANSSKRETKPLTDEDKQLLAEQSKSASELLEETKAQMDTIREQFEKEREQIRLNLQNFKSENQNKINEQKSANEDALKEQKSANQNLLKGTKGDTEKETRSLQEGNSSQKGEIKNNSKSEFDAIKQGLKK
jgi:hypothetical protein